MSTTNAIKSADAAAELNDALAKLETALLGPVVSGELESWARTVEETTAALSARLPEYVNAVLHPQYAEIAKTDAELYTRVEQLIAEDQNLVLEQHAFEKRVREFAQRAAEIKKDEAQATAERSKLEQDGINLSNDSGRRPIRG
jgi:hypothetical protein